MNGTDAPSYTLDGFPAAAVAFVRALEGNRERIARDAGLSASELHALLRIGAVVSITPKKLAVYMGMTTGAITAIARRLVGLGLIHRVDHPQDRRSLFLELTPYAHTVITEIHIDFASMLAASTKSLSAGELDAFTGALRTVAAEVGTLSSTPAAGAPSQTPSGP